MHPPPRPQAWGEEGGGVARSGQHAGRGDVCAGTHIWFPEEPQDLTEQRVWNAGASHTEDPEHRAVADCRRVRSGAQ